MDYRSGFCSEDRFVRHLRSSNHTHETDARSAGQGGSTSQMPKAGRRSRQLEGQWNADVTLLLSYLVVCRAPHTATTRITSQRCLCASKAGHGGCASHPLRAALRRLQLGSCDHSPRFASCSCAGQPGPRPYPICTLSECRRPRRIRTFGRDRLPAASLRCVRRPARAPEAGSLFGSVPRGTESTAAKECPKGLG